MIEWYEQEHVASCVSACVRMVLTGLGQYLPEKEIRQILGNPRFGVTLQIAATKLQAVNTFVEYHELWGIDDLRDCLKSDYYPIVGIERRFFGLPSATHAIVLTKIKSDTVNALDPLLGPASQSYQLETFTNAWQSAGQEVLLLMSAIP